MFKRRDRLPIWQAVLLSLWPKGGWGRAAIYVKHRLRRLPDSPAKISRGIMAGVLTTFTPFYGLHFVFAMFLAWIMRGNIMASILGTFFGNPLTYVPIGIVSLNLGHWILGTEYRGEVDKGLFAKFADAGKDLFWNSWYALTGQPVDWTATAVFWHDVFWPWTIGGIIPGVFTGLACYTIALPLITAYQKRRRGIVKRKLEAIRQRAAETAGKKTKASGPSDTRPV